MCVCVQKQQFKISVNWRNAKKENWICKTCLKIDVELSFSDAQTCN